MANNQYVNKLVVDGVTKLDLSGDTITADKLASGYTAHDASGAPITGTASSGGVIIEDFEDQNGGTIRTITTTNVAVIGQKSITQNGTYTASDDNYDGYSQVTVNVPTDSSFVVTFYKTNDEWSPDKTYGEIASAYSAGKTIITEIDNPWNQLVNAVYGYYFDGGGQMPYFHAYIFEEASGEYGLGAYLYTDYFLYVTGDEIRTESILYYTSSADALASDVRSGKVFFNASGQQTGTLTTRSSSDLTASGATVTVPAGIYDSQATKSITSGSVTAPSTISGTSATVSAGTNTLTLTKSVSVTPNVTTAGYVSSGTAGNASVSLTASVTTQAAQTIYPSSSDQSIASGRYLTGAQTIKAVTTSNLTADNIKKGVTVTVGDSADADRVLSVTGTYEGGGGSTKNIQAYIGRASRTANSYGATTATLTVAKTGTYTVSWTAWRSSSSGTMGTNLHRNSTSGTNQQTWTNTYGQQIKLTNQSYTAGDVLTLYATSGSNSRTINVANLIIEEE